jgi:hypothetical protein
VDAVVISGSGEGDRPAESPEVKASVAGKTPVRSVGEASNLAGRSDERTSEAPKYVPRVKRICGITGSAELFRSRRRPVSLMKELDTCNQRAPRGQRGRHGRKE